MLQAEAEPDCNHRIASGVNMVHDSLFENAALHESEGGFLKNRKQFELE